MLVVDLSTGEADFEDERGFIVQANAAGDLAIRTLGGASDITVSGLAAGDTVAVGDIPVACIALRAVDGGTTTVTAAIIGYL